MSSLIEAFDLKEKSVANYNSLTDYEVFKDKNLLDKLRNKIIEELSLLEIPTDDTASSFINKHIDKEVEGYDLSNEERSYLFNLINDEINGYGPLTNLINDKNITTIMVNSPNEIYIENNGEKSLDTSVSFINNDHILRTLDRILLDATGVVDMKTPIIEARLNNGTKVTAILSPISKKGPVITISKYNTELTDIEELIRLGSLTTEMADYLENAVKSKVNILICGKSGSGRTSLLNVLSNFIPSNERILTIEEGLEIKVNNPNVIALDLSQTSDKNKVIDASLAMRPNRLVIGDINSQNAFNILQIMSTGYEGAISTIHASSTLEALNVLETMIIIGGFNYDTKAIKKCIASAINLIVTVGKTSDGKRRVTKISILKGLENDNFVVKKLFNFIEKGITKNNEIDGEFVNYMTSSTISKSVTSPFVVKEESKPVGDLPKLRD